MQMSRRAGRTALAAAIALGVVAVPAAAITAPTLLSGQTQAAIMPTAASAGSLVLSTTSESGVVEWNLLRQEFSEENQCRIVQAAGTPDLLTLRGLVGDTSGTAGFRNGDIGVYERDDEGNGSSNAAQCFRVDDGSFEGSETLVLRLGADAVDDFGALVATRATVEVFRNSKSGSVLVELVQPDGTVVEATPISWGGGRPGSLVPSSAYTGVFTEIRLTADTGSFSLRGAQFDLASEADFTFCLDGQSGGSYASEDGVTVTHLGNADGTACTAFGIRLTGTDTARVWFIKPLDVDPEAQFVFEVPWNTVAWPALKPGSELPQAFIDFEDTDPPTEIEMPYCPDYLFNAAGELVGLNGSSVDDRVALAALDMVDDVQGDIRTEGTQFACIGDRDATVEKSTSGSGYDVGITDLVYLIGDARMGMK